MSHPAGYVVALHDPTRIGSTFFQSHGGQIAIPTAVSLGTPDSVIDVLSLRTEIEAATAIAAVVGALGSRWSNWYQANVQQAFVELYGNAAPLTMTLAFLRNTLLENVERYDDWLKLQAAIDPTTPDLVVPARFIRAEDDVSHESVDPDAIRDFLAHTSSLTVR